MGNIRPALRFEALDSWRGLCALWVVLYHFRAVSHVYDWDWVRHGDLAVDFFFVLSGFVISHAYGGKLVDGADRFRFLIRRFGRLYPLHFATLAAVFLMELGRWGVSQGVGHPIGRPAFTGDTDLLTLPANLALVHAWGFLREFTWNIPSWSISVEWALCLAYAALSLLRRPFLVVLVLAVGGFGVSVWMGTLPAFPFEGHSALARGVYGFFLGVLVYRLFGFLTARGWALPGWLEWFAPILLALTVLFKGWQIDAAPTLLFAALVLIFAGQSGPISRLLIRRPFLFLGEISYSIYLVHYVLVLAVFGAVAVLGATLGFDGIVEQGRFKAQVVAMPGLWAGDAAAVLFVLLTVGVAALTYKLIETPGRLWFNQLARRIPEPDRPR